MYTTLSRGAAAALLALVSSRAAIAQASAGSVRARDTVIVRMGPPSPAVPDSVRVLMRSLDNVQVGSSNWTLITKQIDSLMGMRGRANVLLRAEKVPDGAALKGYLGLYAQGPHLSSLDSAGQRITYLVYPTIVSVDPESPAERAGIAPGDVLVAYDGVDVIGHEFNMTKLLVPEKKLSVTVRHEGESKDYAVTIGKLPERLVFRMRLGDLPAPLPPPRGDAERETVVTTIVATPRGSVRGPVATGGFFILSPNGVLGANMSPVGRELARALHLASTGVLVNEVPESSPAFTSGLRTGDVVISIAGTPVGTMDQVRSLVAAHMHAREIPLRVVRDEKPRDITVRW